MNDHRKPGESPSIAEMSCRRRATRTWLSARTKFQGKVKGMPVKQNESLAFLPLLETWQSWEVDKSEKHVIRVLF